MLLLALITTIFMLREKDKNKDYELEKFYN